MAPERVRRCNAAPVPATHAHAASTPPTAGAPHAHSLPLLARPLAYARAECSRIIPSPVRSLLRPAFVRTASSQTPRLSVPMSSLQPAPRPRDTNSPRSPQACGRARVSAAPAQGLLSYTTVRSPSRLPAHLTSRTAPSAHLHLPTTPENRFRALPG